MSDKKITLFANGCSHTAGSEIDFPLQSTKYKGAWPRWLADDMGWDWVNVAQPGNSNQQIRRTTFEWIAKNVETEKQFAPKDLVVMIMWSGFERFELWSEADKRLKSYSGNSDISREMTETQQYVKLRTIIDPPGVFQYRSLLDVYTTARYLESLGIKYYFINGLYSWPTIEEFRQIGLKDEYATIYNAYGDRANRHLGFGDDSELFWQYMKASSIEYSPYAKWKHYGEDGQQFWKERLKGWMDSLRD